MTDQPKEFYKLVVVVSFLFVGTRSLVIKDSRHSIGQVLQGAVGSITEEVVNINQEVQGIFTEVTTLGPIKVSIPPSATPIPVTEQPENNTAGLPSFIHDFSHLQISIKPL